MVEGGANPQHAPGAHNAPVADHTTVLHHTWEGERREKGEGGNGATTLVFQRNQEWNLVGEGEKCLGVGRPCAS